ncbi:Uncharacterised protein [Mycobacteroides abscessus subsp. abscessus]|nr:Uncharacterised protein [Mycobacteroides abscessus subsp. abscessus]
MWPSIAHSVDFCSNDHSEKLLRPVISPLDGFTVMASSWVGMLRLRSETSHAVLGAGGGVIQSGPRSPASRTVCSTVLIPASGSPRDVAAAPWCSCPVIGVAEAGSSSVDKPGRMACVRSPILVPA